MPRADPSRGTDSRQYISVFRVTNNKIIQVTKSRGERGDKLQNQKAVVVLRLAFIHLELRPHWKRGVCSSLL
jgi:hypothetical protein